MPMNMSNLVQVGGEYTVICLSGMVMIGGNVIWQVFPGGEPEEGIKISFVFSSFSRPQKRSSIELVKNIIDQNQISWVELRGREWRVDLEALKRYFGEEKVFQDLEWMLGSVQVEPEFEPEEKTFFDKISYEGIVAFYITPDMLGGLTLNGNYPIEIKESLERFRADYPEPNSAVFIIMKFGKTKLHDDIVNNVKKTLESCGLKGVRADDKQYHDDLFYNILTYLYGCGSGIAIFERIEAEEFNPNVSLEVGYMMALRKPVCLLKDKTLKTLHADLVGKLYKTFDLQDITNTLIRELSNWLEDKGLVKR